MPYTHHPEIPSPPADDTVIWQYLSVAELLDLLDSSAVHLTRADRLDDVPIDVERQVSLGFLSGAPAETVRRSFDLMYSVQAAVFTSCWFGSGSSMHHRWERLGGDKSQIAIRSTVKAFKASVSSVPRKLYLSAVQYIDPAALPIPTGNIFLPVLHKRHELRDQKEVRLLTLQTGGQTVFSPGPREGIELPVDLRSMIQDISLAPNSADWLHRLVQTLAERYRLTLDNNVANPSVLAKEVCRFKSTNGCDSCKRSFVPLEAA